MHAAVAHTTVDPVAKQKGGAARCVEESGYQNMP